MWCTRKQNPGYPKPHPVSEHRGRDLGVKRRPGPYGAGRDSAIPVLRIMDDVSCFMSQGSRQETQSREIKPRCQQPKRLLQHLKILVPPHTSQSCISERGPWHEVLSSKVDLAVHGCAVCLIMSSGCLV